MVHNTLEKALEFIIINIQKNLKIKVLSRKSEKGKIRIWLKLLKDVEEKKKKKAHEASADPGQRGKICAP